MTYLTIVLVVLNLTLLVLSIAYFRPLRSFLGNFGRQATSVESDAIRTKDLFRVIHQALSTHASDLTTVERGAIGQREHAGDLCLEKIHRSNREASQSLEEHNKHLAELLGKYGNLYRSERLRIDSYAQSIGDLDNLLTHFEDEAEGSDRILLQLVRDMIQENRLLQSKVLDCQEQVSELVVRSVQSERDARTDSLTRLPNRRAWDEQLATLSGPTSIALVDVDDFKLINDRHGHAAGDAMLTLIGTILRNTHDVSAYRIGGDEFGLLIPAQSDELIAERIRGKIASAVLQFGEAKIKVSVSIGVARWTQDVALPAALRSADEALYKAKETKGNRVGSHQPV